MPEPDDDRDDHDDDDNRNDDNRNDDMPEPVSPAPCSLGKVVTSITWWLVIADIGDIIIIIIIGITTIIIIIIMIIIIKILPNRAIERDLNEGKEPGKEVRVHPCLLLSLSLS